MDFGRTTTETVPPQPGGTAEEDGGQGAAAEGLTAGDRRESTQDMRERESKPETTPGIFEVGLVLLTFVLLVALTAEALGVVPPQVSRIIGWMDLTACGLFFTDFCIRFSRADSKIQFMRWGWIDLVASIPFVNGLRYARLVRLLRVIRVLRGVRAFQRVLTNCLRNRIEAGAVSLGLTSLMLVAFSSIAILTCEQQGGGEIKTAEDAVWWSISTITTVGYGDMVPVTTEGRILGMVLMLAGVGMVAGLGGLAASIFLKERGSNAADQRELLSRLDALQSKIDALTSEAEAQRFQVARGSKEKAGPG